MFCKYISIVLLFFMIGCSTFSTTIPPFRKEIDGIKGSALRSELEEQLVEATEDDDIKNNIDMNLERQNLLKVMHANAYYDATVEPEEIYDKNGDLDVIIYHIESGRRYYIRKIDIFSDIKNIDLPNLEKIELEKGTSAKAIKVLNAQKKFTNYIEQTGCLTQVNIDHKAFLLEDTKQLDVEFTLGKADPAVFNGVIIEGANSFDKDFLLTYVPWQQMDCYSQSQMLDIERILLETGYFSNVHVEPDFIKQESGLSYANIKIQAEERPPRTAKIGVGASMDEILYLTLGWEHRNLYGKGQKFWLDTRFSFIQQNFDIGYKIPRFLDDENRAFSLTTSLKNEEFNVYDSVAWTSAAIIDQKINEHLTFSYGGAYSLQNITQGAISEDDGLLSSPLTLTYDSRDNALNPKEGHYATANIEPVVETINADSAFVITKLEGTHYIAVDSIGWDSIFAFRAKAGAILGTTFSEIPINKRFYAGGGGSVRGYGFQKLGEYANGRPAGGRSLAEMSTEYRFTPYYPYGGVIFLDGGNVYEESLPNPTDGTQWAVGIGFRYFTDFLPIRADLAIPLNKRNKIDDEFGFYISIGQAF